MPDKQVILRSGPARAAIALRGGELREWAIGGVDLLWPGDPAIWAGIAPILFPIVGWTRGGHVRVGGKYYPLGLHGFAADMGFAVAKCGRSHARLILKNEPHTRALYPFAFHLQMEYRLSAAAMEVVLLVENPGGGPMPYAIGLHPGFRWPLADSSAPHGITFEAPERPEVPVIAPGGLFSAKTRPVPLHERTLHLNPDLFANEALCFLNVRSRKLLYDNGAGQGLVLSMANFPHLALWARPPAPFLAIEAWTGHGDPEGFDGDLFDKPSMIVLAPGGRRRHAVCYDFVADTAQLGPDLQPLAHLPKGR